MKKLLALLALCAVLLAGLGWWLSRPAHSTEEKWPVQPVAFGSMIDSVSATGTVQPQEVAWVASELPGRVQTIEPEADYNRAVKAGQPLIQLDKELALGKVDQGTVAIELARADVDRAKAARFAADLALTRQRELMQKGGFQKDVDVAEAQLKAAEAVVKAAEVRVKEAEVGKKLADTGVSMTTLKAPCDGIVIKRSVALGQTVSPMTQAPLLVIARSLQTMEVHAQIAEGDVAKVREGSRASFTVNAYEDHFTGKVISVRKGSSTPQGFGPLYSPTGPGTGAVYYTAIVAVDNVWNSGLNSWKLLPDMPASVDVVRHEHAETWKVPTAALGFQPDESHLTEAARAKLANSKGPDWRPVWVLDAQKRPTPLWVRVGGANALGEPGIQDQQYTEVLEWQNDLQPTPDPKKPETWPQVITGPPPGGKPGLLDKGIKIF